MKVWATQGRISLLHSEDLGCCVYLRLTDDKAASQAMFSEVALLKADINNLKFTHHGHPWRMFILKLV